MTAPPSAFVSMEPVNARSARVWIGRVRPETFAFITAGVAIAFLVLWPIGWLIGGTLFTGAGEFTLRYWRHALAAPFLFEATYNTLFVSLLATVIAVVVGVILALVVARTDMPGARVFELISLVPFITPPIVLGVAWIILGDREAGLLNVLFASLGVDLRVNILSFWGLVFVSSLYMIPFVFFLVIAPMRQINSELEDAALVCGASRLRTIVTVSLPMLLPAITSGALLSFMYSNNLFGIHVVIGRPADVWMLTTAIYSSMSIMPVDFHQAAIQSLILVAFAGAAMWLQARTRGRRGFSTLTGKGFRTAPISLGPWRWIAAMLCGLYILAVVVLPYLVIILRSLNRYSFQPGRSWFDALRAVDLSEYAKAMFADAASQRAIWNSMWLSLVAALATLILAAVTAYMIQQKPSLERRALGAFCMIPMALPGVVLGVAAIFGYTAYPFALYGTSWIILLAYIAKDLPIAFQAADSSLLQIHGDLEDAARLCGASWLHRFRTVLLPLARPGLVIGLIMVFASMARELGASILLFSPGHEIFAYTIFNAWEEGRWQAMSSFIVINTLIVLVCVAGLLRLSRLRFVTLAQSSARPEA